MAMSYMLEVYYKAPVNQHKEAELPERVSELGGRLDYREEDNGQTSSSICLTYEFDDRGEANAAADSLRQNGEHVEGPQDYGT
jgi:hypothetical protein